MENQEKIKAIYNREALADGQFWYGVRTTGIVCRPSSRSRKPLLKNIELFDSVEDAVTRGYRTCKICMK